MILLSHEPVIGGHYMSLDLRNTAEAARQSGIRVHSMPIEITEPENALGWLDFEAPTLGVLSTYIQREKTYRPLYEAALERNIYLIHTPEQNSRLMEFELFYPTISHLTARSVIVKDDESLDRAQKELTFPVFTKGQIKSVKEQGWEACIAKTPEDLALRYSKWGQVIARNIMPMRQRPGLHGSFPESREYRAFWLDGKVVGQEYYWDGQDHFGPLAPEEKKVVEDLIQEAATSLDCPFVTVDVAQMEDLSWKIVEIGDPQYSGICHMPRHLLWERIKQFETKWLKDC